MPDIKKPDANPMVAALLTAFVLGLGHLIVNGQQKKWIITLIVCIVGGIFTCGLASLPLLIINVLEAYQTAERLQKGETIGENEYSFELMYKICKIIDKTATLKGQTPPSA